MTTATAPTTRFGIWPVAAAGVVLALAILFAALGRHAGIGTVQLPAAEAAASIDLLFHDQEGSIRVLSASDGALLLTVPPGEGGFMRGVMRGLARDRKMRGIGPEQPFRLERRVNGMLILHDTATGRDIALGSFGPTNLEAFSQLLHNKEGSS